MPQDAFTLRLVAKELDDSLRGGRINKINQPGRDELSLLIYTGKRTLKLILNANASDCGAYFSEEEQENPLVAPNFCMLLRKHLAGAEILGVATNGFERILVMRLMCRSDFSSAERELRAEIMGKYSNLILTENGVILGALKTTTLDEHCKRAILPGARYTLPEPQPEKVNPSDRAALQHLLSARPQGDMADFLFRHVSGLAPCTAEEIAASYAGGDLAAHVYDYIFSDEISPRVTKRDGNVVDFFARAQRGIPFASISDAQSYFYRRRRAKKMFEAEARRLHTALSSAVKKEEKRLGQIMDRALECRGAELNRIKGELITANLYRLSRGMKSCELENYYDGKTLRIVLDETLTPAQNAQNYFRRYRKQQRALQYLQPQEAEVRGELDYAHSLLAALMCAEREEDLKSIEEEMTSAGFLRAPQEQRTRKTKAEIPFRTFEKDGFHIFAGRNNLQNDRLLRSAAPEDIWLHAQRYHSCHVIIRTEGRTVPEAVIAYAAAICARYSDAGGDRVPVDYCPAKFVRKPPKAKAGFVTYSSFRTIYIDPLKEGER